MNDLNDEQLLKKCVAGEHAAFEQFVLRYQTLVCSVAYSVVGNVTTSEDIGQETFLIAWKQLGELRDPSRLKSWLASIARNQALAWRRRPANATRENYGERASTQATTENTLMNDEELGLVWKTLEELPESYREPLILFYRHEQSIAEVADALELSQSAVKQRLSRGREMLRQEVAATVERTLRKTVPTTAFTVAVMSLHTSGKSAAAATIGSTAVTAAKMASSAGGLGAAGAATGTLLGLAGGFLGTYVGWKAAEYLSQRQLIVRQTTLHLIGLSPIRFLVG